MSNPPSENPYLAHLQGPNQKRNSQGFRYHKHATQRSHQPTRLRFGSATQQVESHHKGTQDSLDSKPAHVKRQVYNDGKKKRKHDEFQSNEGDEVEGEEYSEVKGKQTLTSNISSKPKQSFIYGNYRNYYGYRNKSSSGHIDPRLTVLERDWFVNRDVLDIGCNSGVVTVQIAQIYKPRHIHGVDIDPELIKAAWRHRRFQFSLMRPTKDSDDGDLVKHDEEEMEYFPMAMPHMFGTIPILEKNVDEEYRRINVEEEGHDKNIFPHNITFECRNWVPADDLSHESEQQEDPTCSYDVVLALSVTKWIHLNWGDNGLKRFFHKIHRVLRPGGIFILEPQEWSTFARRAKMDEAMKINFQAAKFFPADYESFLLGEVGFKTSRLLGEAENKAKGFQRPLYLFSK